MSDLKFNCPHCNQSLEAPEDLLGKTIDCPSCNGSISVPTRSFVKRQPAAHVQCQNPQTLTSRSNRTQSGKSTARFPCVSVVAACVVCVLIGGLLVYFFTHPRVHGETPTVAKTSRRSVSLGGPRIDTSTEESYSKSLEKMKKSLSEQENNELEEALQALLFSNVNEEDGLFEAIAQMADTGKLQASLFSQIDGKNAREIIALAKEKRRGRRMAELASITQEISSLEKKREEATKSAAILAKLPISSPRFYWSEGAFSSEPAIEFKIANQTGVAISRVFFHGTVSTPGRTIPWIDEDFNYTVSGGLEHGETKHLQLTPNQFGPWGNRDVMNRTDTVLVMRVVNARDAANRDLAVEFGKTETDRLSELYRMRKKSNDGI